MNPIEIRDGNTGGVERYANHSLWIGQYDLTGRKIYTDDIVELQGAHGGVIGRFRVQYVPGEGRFILVGLTPGAHTSRITKRQVVRVVGRSANGGGKSVAFGRNTEADETGR